MKAEEARALTIKNIRPPDISKLKAHVIERIVERTQPPKPKFTLKNPLSRWPILWMPEPEVTEALWDSLRADGYKVVEQLNEGTRCSEIVISWN